MIKRVIGVADYAGMTAAALCLLHCLGPPLLLAAFPLVNWFPHDDGLHAWLLILVALPALVALVAGFRQHRRSLVLALGACGFACCCAAVLVAGPLYGHGAEAVLTSIGGLFIFAAHLKNRSFCAGCVASNKPACC